MISASVCLSSQPDTAVQPAKEFCSYTTCWDTILSSLCRAAAADPAPTAPAMPPFGWKLSNRQVADVLTYIRNAWGNRASPVTAADVGAARRTLASRAP